MSFRGTLTLVSGDNLGSNFIGGYKHLSSALRKCRFCMAVAEDMREKVITYFRHQNMTIKNYSPLYAVLC